MHSPSVEGRINTDELMLMHEQAEKCCMAHLVVKMVQEAHRQQRQVEIRSMCDSFVDTSPQAGPLHYQGSWHTDNDRDQSGVGIDGCRVQILNAAHGPANTGPMLA